MPLSKLSVTVMQLADALVHCHYCWFVFHFHVSFPLLFVLNLTHFPLLLFLELVLNSGDEIKSA